MTCFMLADSQICHGFKENNLIPSEWKFKLLFPLGVSNSFVHLRELVNWPTARGHMFSSNQKTYLIMSWGVYRGYYMPAYGYEFYLRVVNSISHSFAQAHLVFHWCLYNKTISFTRVVTSQHWVKYESLEPIFFFIMFLVCPQKIIDCRKINYLNIDCLSS